MMPRYSGSLLITCLICIGGETAPIFLQNASAMMLGAEADTGHKPTSVRLMAKAPSMTDPSLKKQQHHHQAMPTPEAESSDLPASESSTGSSSESSPASSQTSDSTSEASFWTSPWFLMVLGAFCLASMGTIFNLARRTANQRSMGHPLPGGQSENPSPNSHQSLQTEANSRITKLELGFTDTGNRHPFQVNQEQAFKYAYNRIPFAGTGNPSEPNQPDSPAVADWIDGTLPPLDSVASNPKPDQKVIPITPGSLEQPPQPKQGSPAFIFPPISPATHPLKPPTHPSTSSALNHRISHALERAANSAAANSEAPTIPPVNLSAAIPPLEVETGVRFDKLSLVDGLIRDLHSPLSDRRRRAIWELGQRGDTRAVKPLVDLMFDSDSKQRSLILSALSEIGIRTLKPMTQALAISLQDESPEVRKNAVRDLTRVYDMVTQISYLLHEAAEDPDEDVQETARWALSQLDRIQNPPPVKSLHRPTANRAISPAEKLRSRDGRS